MTSLTAKQQAFIQQMTENDELARHGFTLLLKRNDFADFFDALVDAGLFDPSRNPRPVPAAEEGSYRIPYWNALDYLVALAKLTGEQNDLELAKKVMAIVRAVSSWRDESGKPQENYHTAQKLATILGYVPTQVVSCDDLQFIPAWLNNRFERMLVSMALDEIVLPHFLGSQTQEDWEKAVLTIDHCTTIEWSKGDEANEESPRTLVEEFWLKRLVVNHVPNLGSKLGNQTACVFERRIREVFNSDIHRKHSTIYRPAIEDHAQNHRFRAAENIMVDGLRDVLLAWAEHDPESARRYVEHLIVDELEILRRIGIYLLDRQWKSICGAYPTLLSRQPFTTGHLHELYNLLNEHFVDFRAEEQDRTVAALRDLPMPTWGEDRPAVRKRLQQRWLSAMTGKGCRAADEWFAELRADPDVGALPQHPDFTSFMTTWQGPGASPYSVAEIVELAKANVLSERLNAFRQKEEWRGPTLDGLASVLQDAARTEPSAIVMVLPDLLKAKPLFQHSVIRGLKDAWDAVEKSASTGWADYWEQMIAFFEQLLANEEFWRGEDDHRDWVVSAIADCLHAGTQKDEHAYAPELLPRTLALLRILLTNATSSTDCPDDPMMRALNTPKGRVIEALFSQALRACRVSDRANGRHEESWLALRPLFDAETNQCRNANYEFSTLCGAYLSQLDYLNSAWTAAMMPQIFPAEFPNNERCAIAGLGHAPFTRAVYERLLAGGVIDRALRYDLIGRNVREAMLARIAAAYLWGLESLDSPRFEHLFSIDRIDELRHVAWVLWTVRDQETTAEQKERILQFWERCTTWSRTLPVPPANLLSSLSALACFLPDADGRSRGLLLAVAPYVHVDHSSYEFVEELLRLVEVSPDGVSEVLEVMVTAHVPEFDYENNLQALLRALIAKGKRTEAIRILEQMRTLPGTQQLFDLVTSGQP